MTTGRPRRGAALPLSLASLATIATHAPAPSAQKRSRHDIVPATAMSLCGKQVTLARQEEHPKGHRDTRRLATV